MYVAGVTTPGTTTVPDAGITTFRSIIPLVGVMIRSEITTPSGGRVAGTLYAIPFTVTVCIPAGIIIDIRPGICIGTLGGGAVGVVLDGVVMIVPGVTVGAPYTPDV